MNIIRQRAEISLEELKIISTKSILMRPAEIGESESSRKYDRLNITREKAYKLLGEGYGKPCYTISQKELKKYKKGLNRIQPIKYFMESLKYDALVMLRLKIYKLLYADEVTKKLIKDEYENRVIESKISACEYYIEELLNEVKKCSYNQKLIDDTKMFLAYIKKL